MRSCPKCHSEEMGEGTTSLSLQDEGVIVTFIGLPAEVCGSCGQALLSSEVASAIFHRARALREENDSDCMTAVCGEQCLGELKGMPGWEALQNKTDEEILQVIEEDPDTHLLEDGWFKKAEVIRLGGWRNQ